MEYSFSFVAVIGMSWRYGVEDASPRGSCPSPRTGASTSRSGASARASRPRSGPGRCPCRCSRGRRRRRRAARAAAHEVLHDDRSGQRRHQRVPTLVQRVGLAAPGATKSVGELVARRRRTSTSTAPAASARSLHRLPVAGRRLADVGGTGRRPPRRPAPRCIHRTAHRRVESSAVCEHHSLRPPCAPFSFDCVSRARPARPRETCAMVAPPALCARRTSSVSSPATVPRTPGRARPGRGPTPTTWAAPRRRAQHDQVRRVTRPRRPTHRQHTAQVVVGRQLVGLVLRDGVHGLAAGHPHLDGAQILQVARHGRLRRR